MKVAARASLPLVLLGLCSLFWQTSLAAASPNSVSSAAWRREETRNFTLWYPASLASYELARRVEAEHQRLSRKWLGETPADAWSPKCLVVFHAEPQSYVRHVGAFSQQTSGSSLVERKHDRVAVRRIDLRIDREGWLGGTLSHELTHVILADRFRDDELPRWADEGMAILADTAAKQSLHSQSLESALVSRSEFRLVELLRLGEYPAAHRWGAFYGQSASIVRFLVERQSPDEFVQFLETAQGQHYDLALREHYGIDGVDALERTWRRQVSSVPGQVAVR